MKSEVEIRKARDFHLNNPPHKENIKYWEGVLDTYNFILGDIRLNELKKGDVYIVKDEFRKDKNNDKEKYIRFIGKQYTCNGSCLEFEFPNDDGKRVEFKLNQIRKYENNEEKGTCAGLKL